MTPARGKFITIEGGEGAGKSTSIECIRQLLDASGIESVFTREPGGTGLGEEVRQLLLGHRHTGMSAEAELLLMFAARAEHLHSVIVPALASGKWVVCDRFTDASYAYQGGGRGIAPDRIRILEAWVQKGMKPDLTLLLDLPVETGLARAGNRSAPDRFELEQRHFFERVRDTYLRLALEEPGRIKVIDAGRSPEEVQAEITRHLRQFILPGGDHV